MTVVTVHSAITNRPVPGATFDTNTDTLQSVVAKALTFPEVRNASWDDRIEAQDILSAFFAGSYPYSGDIRDSRFAKYGISHISVTPSEAPEAATPIYSETLAAQSGLTPEASRYLSGLSGASVRSTPEDFKAPAKVGIFRKLARFFGFGK